MSPTIQEIALETLEIETNAIKNLKNYIDADFSKIVNLILGIKGRVVVSGVGKSAIIANKIVATLNSTGTPAIFMHAADAIHGDLGIIQKDDVVICISKSGNTSEIKALVPLLKGNKNVLIGMVGNIDSYLARQSDYIINTTVEREACPNNLAPTSSSTAQLVMGDALAVSLLKSRGFTSEDFARYHPGGALGKKLYLKVSDIYVYNQQPKNNPADTINQVILEISAKRLGATAILDSNGKLMGLITDGDLRRMLEKQPDFKSLRAEDIMTKNPITINKDTLASEALDIMKERNINQLVVTEENLKYLGVIHIQDLVKEGLI